MYQLHKILGESLPCPMPRRCDWIQAFRHSVILSAYRSAGVAVWGAGLSGVAGRGRAPYRHHGQTKIDMAKRDVCVEAQRNERNGSGAEGNDQAEHKLIVSRGLGGT